MLVQLQIEWVVNLRPWFETQGTILRRGTSRSPIERGANPIPSPHMNVSGRDRDPRADRRRPNQGAAQPASLVDGYALEP